MPRKQHTRHYIYKVTCNVTGKYYIGMHSTSNLEDGYFGSGKVLKRSLNKHGKTNHSIEILEWLPDRSSLKLREMEIVNEQLLADQLCMNLQLGGGGGFSGEENQRKWSAAGGKSAWEKNREALLISTKNGGLTTLTKGIALFSQTNKRFSGKFHTDETRRIIGQINSVKQAGNKNSQFGTVWINRDGDTLKIKKDDLEKYVMEGWARGRK